MEMNGEKWEKPVVLAYKVADYYADREAEKKNAGKLCCLDLQII